MNDKYTHVSFGFEVAEVQHAVEGAIDTILWFDESVEELETKLGELNRFLDDKNISTDLVFEVFKIISHLRFHLEEAGEYQSILQRMDIHHHRAVKATG